MSDAEKMAEILKDELETGEKTSQGLAELRQHHQELLAENKGKIAAGGLSDDEIEETNTMIGTSEEIIEAINMVLKEKGTAPEVETGGILEKP